MHIITGKPYLPLGKKKNPTLENCTHDIAFWTEVKLPELRALQSASFLPRTATCVCPCVYSCPVYNGSPHIVPGGFMSFVQEGRTMGTLFLPGQTAFTCVLAYLLLWYLNASHCLHSYKCKQEKETGMSWKENSQ